MKRLLSIAFFVASFLLCHAQNSYVVQFRDTVNELYSKYFLVKAKDKVELRQKMFNYSFGSYWTNNGQRCHLIVMEIPCDPEKKDYIQPVFVAQFHNRVTDEYSKFTLIRGAMDEKELKTKLLTYFWNTKWKKQIDNLTAIDLELPCDPSQTSVEIP